MSVNSITISPVAQKSLETGLNSLIHATNNITNDNSGVNGRITHRALSGAIDDITQQRVSRSLSESSPLLQFEETVAKLSLSAKGVLIKLLECLLRTASHKKVRDIYQNTIGNITKALLNPKSKVSLTDFGRQRERGLNSSDFAQFVVTINNGNTSLSFNIEIQKSTNSSWNSTSADNLKLIRLHTDGDDNERVHLNFRDTNDLSEEDIRLNQLIQQRIFAEALPEFLNPKTS